MKAPPVLHSDVIRAAAGCRRPPKTETLYGGDRPWGIHTCRTLEQIRAIRSVWETLKTQTCSDVDVEADFDRYVGVVESTPDCEPYTLLAFKEGKPHALLAGTRGSIKISCKFGYLNLLKPSLRGITIIYGGHLGHFDEGTCRKLLEHLYTSVRHREADVVMFKQLPLTHPLYSSFRKEYPALCRSHFPKVDGHWQMPVPDRMESFYAQHSSKTRQTLKRQLRQIEKHFQVRLAECRDANALPETLSQVETISERTYQHALGWGLVNDAKTRKQLLTAAGNGRLRLHLLYLNDEPCAFQLGLQYEKKYFLKQMGFNPDMKKWHPGTALFLKVLDRLCSDPDVHDFDFGFGDAEYKKRFATQHWDETSLYVFAPRVYPVLVNMTHTMICGFSESVRRLIRKTGIEEYIKRKWRNRLQEKRHSHST